MAMQLLQMLPLLLLGFGAAAAYTPSKTRPEQVHIAFGSTPDRLAVQWSTACDGGSSSACRTPPPRTQVRFGRSPDALDAVAEGSATLFTDFGPARRRQWMHVANLSGLTAWTRYYYQVGDLDQGAVSPTFSVRTAPDAATLDEALPLRVAVYGDMGVEKDGSTVKRQLAKAIRRDPDAFAMVLHVGDFAYDMDERDGRQGDLFMREVEPIAAHVPYMVDMGNHEKAYQFSHYTERFRNMPISDWSEPIRTFNGPAPNNWWYSFNLGPVHVVAISTEVYDYAPWYIRRQWEWLEADLAAANANRTQAPWIIAHGHKPLYCSSPTPAECDAWYSRQRDGVLLPSSSGNSTTGMEKHFGLEELFHRFGVDLYLCGHQHNSERHYDVAFGASTQATVDPPATTYIVTGAGGNREDITQFTTDAPPRVASRALEWGYSVLEVHNATHLYYEQRGCDGHGGHHDRDAVIDSVWLVQRQHGSFVGRSAAGGVGLEEGVGGGGLTGAVLEEQRKYRLRRQ